MDLTIGDVAAAISAFLIGGVELGWVASVGWKRSHAIPSQWRSVAYLYGCSIILLCLYVVAWVSGDWAAFRRECAVMAICGLWTISTHFTHARSDGADIAAAPPVPTESGEGDAE